MYILMLILEGIIYVMNITDTTRVRNHGLNLKDVD